MLEIVVDRLKGEEAKEEKVVHDRTWVQIVLADKLCKEVREATFNFVPSGSFAPAFEAAVTNGSANCARQRGQTKPSHAVITVC